MLVCIDSIANSLEQCDVNICLKCVTGHHQYLRVKQKKFTNVIVSLSLVSEFSIKQTTRPNINVPVQYVYLSNKNYSMFQRCHGKHRIVLDVAFI